MSTRKRRLTITVDPELIAAGREAVAAGEAESVSGWVNAAIEDKIRRDRTLHLLRASIAEYEQEFGEITDEEIAAQRRSDRHDATVVRGGRRSGGSKAKSA